jgi:formylglycine-generating enzyme required for sulfatase activity/dienelactone hydrolase
VGALHWKIEKAGFTPVEGRFWWGLQRRVKLHAAADTPRAMVYAPGGTLALGTGPLPNVQPFWIDRDEVTNAAFKSFVDAGGYRDRRWWKEEIVRDGRSLSWDDAVSLFVDRTGRPGPATWEGGSYPPGRADYPVGGLSWYEAAAFAEFSGRSLPLVHQWRFAGGPGNLRDDVRLANIAGSGPLAVSALRDLGPHGTYGLAGNIKEWCWNAVDGQRYIMGGGWHEPPYMAVAPDARPPLDRAETNGVRLVKHISAPTAGDLAEVRILPQHFPRPAPVSDDVFAAYRRFYSYEDHPLDVRAEALAETDEWIQERVSIAAAYGQERIPVQILKPRNAAPPYQAVIWFPGTYSLQLGEAERMTLSYYFDFVVKSGRAVVMPDFQGMYSRRRALPATARQPDSDAYREHLIQSAKDLNRTFDYLATRGDMDRNKVVFYVFSAGGATLPVPAMEPRLAGLIFLSAGLPRRAFPPEIEPANFAPRIKMPVLLLGGRHDYMAPMEASQKPLFDLLGTPPSAKRHVIFESGHVPDRIAVIREVLGWLDRTLGLPTPKQ